MNNHNVLLYCPNKHQTIRHRESAGWQHFEKSGNRASMEVRMMPHLSLKLTDKGINELLLLCPSQPADILVGAEPGAVSHGFISL